MKDDEEHRAAVSADEHAAAANEALKKDRKEAKESCELITKEALQRSFNEASKKVFLLEAALLVISTLDQSVYTREFHAVVAKNVASSALDGLHVRRDDTGVVYFSMDHVS